MISEWLYEVGRYVGIGPVDRNASTFDQSLLLLRRSSVRSNWSYPEVEFYPYDDSGKRVKRAKQPEYFASDAPGHNYLSGAAVRALRDILDEYGEVLPLESKDGEFYVYHCMNEIDAIDPPRCEFDGMNIIKYEFKREVVRGQHIFRPSFPYRTPVFVSDWFVDRVKSAGLKGFKFIPLWSEETGPIVEEPPTPVVEQVRRGKTCKPMSKAARRDLDKVLVMAKKDLGVDVAADGAGKVLERIGLEAQSAQGRAHRIDEILGVAMLLGGLWGELVCRDFGWQWMMVDGTVAVVSPSRSHVAFVQSWIYDLIAAPGRAPKILELYGMIKSGELPPAEAASHLVVV